MSQTKSRSRRKKGQALAEMAVMAPFLVICMMGMLDLGRAFYYQISITNAVREAARYAALPYYTGLAPVCNTMPPASNPGPNCPVPGDGAAYGRLTQELTGTGINVNQSDFNVVPSDQSRVGTCGTSGACSSQLTVTATYKFSFITPIIGDLIGNPLTLKSSSTFRTEY